MMELLTNEQMNEVDRLTISQGIAGIELMENAGRAVADNVLRRHPTGTPITVVAGPGNNGGDGLIAARLLSERGYRSRVLLLADIHRFKGDARIAVQRWNGPCEPATPGAIGADSVVIDALFGAGLDRPVDSLAREMIEAMNGGGYVHAVDLPSGINGSNAAVMGLAVRANETVTFFRRKLGHVLLPGRIHCGTIHVADIGIGSQTLAAIKPRVWINSPDLWLEAFPMPAVAGHKYSRGHAVVVSGGLYTTGAARLAARGALRAGAGLITIASPRDALLVNAAANLAVMVRPVDGEAEFAEFLQDARRNAVVIGPGGGVGNEMRKMVFAALAGERAVVLDADALTSFAEDPQALIAATAGRRSRRSATLLTPHEGEFLRLFKAMEEIVHAPSKLEKSRQAAVQTGAICLLKGADTVVAAPDGRASILYEAPPWLASAGAGDVLAGIAGGLLAQGMPGFEAASAAVWLHAQAGMVAGPGLIAEDLSEALPRIFARLFERGAAHRPNHRYDAP
jgi:hydroxyethylthiazole kinase-like uncharacterized protein yjeF